MYFCSGSLAVWHEGLGYFTHNLKDRTPPERKQ
nr:MAG TPA: hypothetical protein [Caudoviricetes sp.]